MKFDYSNTITNSKDRQIWKIKNKKMFNILLNSLKLIIKQVIKSWINKDKKNTAELWQALETKYRIYITNK